MHRLPRSFFSRKTVVVAKDLLGKILVRKFGMKTITAKIVETEAYLFDDPASHTFGGLTQRNKVMFGEAGYLYVYFTYGMHYCANVVTAKEGIGEAVLIRAVEPVDGINAMIKNRFKDKPGSHFLNGSKPQNLTNGPAKTAQAFALTTEQSGTDLTGDEIFFMDNDPIPNSSVVKTTRIGISAAQEKLLRFYIKGNTWVSKK